MIKIPTLSKLGTDTSDVPGSTNMLLFLTSETGQKTVLLPIQLLLTWLFYKKYNRSFKENSWFTLYISGHGSLLSLPLILYWYITKDSGLFATISSIIELGYWIWASKQFYTLSIGRAIFLRIMMYVTFFFTFTILGGLLGILIKALY